MLTGVKTLILVAAFVPNMAHAQSQAQFNVFFGFEFTLIPIAIKWTCGGDAEQDLRTLDLLIAAFPDEAEAAEIPTTIELLLDVSTRVSGLADLVGAELTRESHDMLCDAALPLRIDWVTPENLSSDQADGMSPDQRAAWEAFFLISESLQ